MIQYQGSRSFLKTQIEFGIMFVILLLFQKSAWCGAIISKSKSPDSTPRKSSTEKKDSQGKKLVRKKSVQFGENTWINPPPVSTSLASEESLSKVTVQPRFLEPLTVLLDIDDTLVFNIPDPSKSVDRYFAVHGFVEFMTYLRSQENIDIGFFSAGSRNRNIPLLQAMLQSLVSDHAPFYEVRVFSHEELHCGKKDLARLGLDLKSVLLVDDNSESIATDQHLNHVPVLSGHYEIFNSYDSPFELNMEVLVRNNLVFALGVIGEVLEMREKSSQIDVRTALAQIYQKMNQHLNHEEDEKALEPYWSYFLKGKEMMQTVNPAFEFWHLETAQLQSPTFITELPIAREFENTQVTPHLPESDQKSYDSK